MLQQQQQRAELTSMKRSISLRNLRRAGVLFVQLSISCLCARGQRFVRVALGRMSRAHCVRVRRLYSLSFGVCRARNGHLFAIGGGGGDARASSGRSSTVDEISWRRAHCGSALC